MWSEWQDSNLRHSAPKADALPTAPHPEIYGNEFMCDQKHTTYLLYMRQGRLSRRILRLLKKSFKKLKEIFKKVLTFQKSWYIMINVAGDELECLLLLEKCESGGTGRRARLRGVWIHRTGSSPVSRTNSHWFQWLFIYADMAELVDALVSGSSGRPCRFKSCYPHQKKAHICLGRQMCAFFNEINPLRDLWNALRAWNTLRVWNALRRVRGFISFHIATEGSNISQFTEWIISHSAWAEYFTKKRNKLRMIYTPLTRDWGSNTMYITPLPWSCRSAWFCRRSRR